MCDNKGSLIVISGFSGSGKGTIVSELINRYDGYVVSVSVTTRKPRENEIYGMHYFFKTESEFELMIERGELIEYAKYVDNYYGTPKEYVENMLKAGKNVILEIEVVGAKKIKELYNDAVTVFVMPPNIAKLKDRLENRGTEDESVLKQRLNRSKEELEYTKYYDYILINDKLDFAVEDIHSIVCAHKHKMKFNEEFLRKIKSELEKV